MKLKKLEELAQSRKEIFLLFFFLLLFPPLPRVNVSLIFKIEFGIIIALFFSLCVFLFVKKKKFKYSINFLIVFFIAFLWGFLNGLFRGNQLYIMAKDIAYFFTPVLVYLILLNNEKWFDKEFFSALFRFGTIVSLMQIFFSLWGMYLHIDREILRHVFLMFSTEVIPFIIVFRIVQKGTVLDKRVFLYTIALLLTKGRSDLLFVVFVFVGYYWWKFFKALFFRMLYIPVINASFTVLWLIPFFYPEVLHFVKASIRWRYVEWQSFFIFIKNVSLFDFLTGQGFGSLLPSLKPLHLFLGNKIIFLNKFHNIFLFLIFKLGVIGIIFYFLISFFIFQNLGKCKNMCVFVLKVLFSFYLFVLPVVHGGFTMSVSCGIFLGVILYLSGKKDVFCDTLN